MRAPDITLIMNYFYANSSMKQGETWTPICIPGISEEHLLHIYMRFYTANLGLIFIATESSFDVFHEYKKAGENIYEAIVAAEVLSLVD